MGESTVNGLESAPIYSEALASWSVRYRDPTGFECQLTLEAETGKEVLVKAEAALARLIEAKCEPLHNGNGNHIEPSKEAPTSSRTIQKVEGQGSKKVCPVHHIEMQLWQKGTKTWYSHRWEGSWCKGEAA